MLSVCHVFDSAIQHHQLYDFGIHDQTLTLTLTLTLIRVESSPGTRHGESRFGRELKATKFQFINRSSQELIATNKLDLITN
jgi:hypothetical protein